MGIPARKKPPGVSAVYAIANMANGKVYIGSTHDLKIRFKRHRAELDRGAHYNEHLQRAWSKHGSPLFMFLPLVICEVGELERIEQAVLNQIPANMRYNVCVDSVFLTRGIKHSERARSNMSKSKSGERNPAWGTRHSEEHKRKIGEKSIGNSYASGHRDTPETRAKKSRSQTIRYQSLELRQKAREYANRRWHKTGV